MLGVDNWKVKYLDLCNDVKCGENDGNSHRCSDYLQEDMLFFTMICVHFHWYPM